MRVFVRCGACRRWMVPDDSLLAGPFYMCKSCWKDYWKELTKTAPAKLSPAEPRLPEEEMGQ